MKKGFTLIELVVVVALSTILLRTASISVANMLERRALEEAKNRMIEVLRLYTDKSFNEAEEYNINLDYTDEVIRVRDADGNIEEEIELPEMLRYYVNIDFDGDPDREEIRTTVKGGVKRLLTDQLINFSIYVYDRNENARYRIAVDGINASRLVHINVDQNRSATTATWSNRTTYTFNGSDWERE